MEIIDKFLEKNLVTQDQYEAAVTLCKLHDIIFGRAGIKAYNPLRIKGRSCKKIDENFLLYIEKEYSFLIDILSKNNLWKVVSDICIYQNDHGVFSEFNNYIKKNHAIESLRDGLDILYKHFKARNNRTPDPIKRNRRKYNFAEFE